MPMQLSEEDGGKIIAVRVSGTLTGTDHEVFVPALERLLLHRGRVRLLFDTTGFLGWETGVAWEHLRVGVAHFNDIECIATVGETRWQRVMATFCKPFRKAAVRHFDHADVDGARKWLRAG